MTQEQERREATYREWTWFGAFRFTLYVCGGLALMTTNPLAGGLIAGGSALGLFRSILKVTGII